MSVFSNLSTIISIAAGATLLNEDIFLYHIVGSTLIIIGVIGTNLFKNGREFKKGNYVKVKHQMNKGWSHILVYFSNEIVQLIKNRLNEMANTKNGVKSPTTMMEGLLWTIFVKV